MRDLRQGNDLAVIWSILRDGKPFNLSGKKLKLYLKNMYERREVDGFTARGNQIHWTFYGKDQKTTGKYSLILVANEDAEGMITTDTCDFVRLVSCTCKIENGIDSPNVETETIELTSNLDYVAGTGGGGEGGGSYDDTAIWKAVNNKVDKVVGKGLSTNDYTDADKSKLARLENYDDTKLKEEIAETYATKDYVNEEVGNAGGGGEGCECATPDWSAPEGKEGHILNRTHYKDVETYDSTFKYNEDGEALTPKYARLRDDYGNLSDLLPVSDDFEEFLDGFPLYDEYGDTTGYASGTLIVQPYNHTIRFDSDYEDEHYYVESVYESLKQLDEEFIPDTIARKSELTELSAELGNKQDAITDLENIREGAKKGATALQSVPDTYATKKFVEDAINEIPQGGGGSTTDLTAVAKWGVVTQTLKSVGNANDGYVVQASNPVKGWIPQSFIDEVTSFGGICLANSVPATDKPLFNETTGYFEYRGITNLAYDEMRAAYMVGKNLFANGIANFGYAVQYTSAILAAYENKLRCLLHNPAKAEMGFYRFHSFLSYAPFFELGIFNMEFSSILLYSSGINYAFTGCACLKEIGYFDAAQITSNIAGFSYNSSLEKLFLRGLKTNLNIGASSFFKEECILYMIEKSAATSAITITLHANAYARAMANAEIVAALEAHPNVSLASA